MNGKQFWELYQSYGDVYLNEEVQIDEELTGSRLKKAKDRISQISRSTGTATLKAVKRHQRKQQKINASYDYTDLIMNHLLDEGYVDSVEDAIVLMANMSEQWIETIVEEADGEMARLRHQMKIALQKGDKETIAKISRRLADIQPKAQAQVGAELRGLIPRRTRR